MYIVICVYIYIYTYTYIYIYIYIYIYTHTPALSLGPPWGCPWGRSKPCLWGVREGTTYYGQVSYLRFAKIEIKGRKSQNHCYTSF